MATQADAGERRKMAHTRSRGYPGVMRALHWLTVVLLIGGYTAVWAIGKTTPDAEADWLAMLHHSFGVTILGLTVVRLLCRQTADIPELPPDIPVAQRRAARASVATFYVILIAQPVLGITGSMLDGDPVTVFGNLVIPSILPVDKPVADLVFRLHGWDALLLLGLIGLHVAAALYHRFVRHDDVLSGMLPWRTR